MQYKRSHTILFSSPASNLTAWRWIFFVALVPQISLLFKIVNKRLYWSILGAMWTDKNSILFFTWFVWIITSPVMHPSQHHLSLEERPCSADCRLEDHPDSDPLYSQDLLSFSMFLYPLRYEPCHFFSYIFQQTHHWVRVCYLSFGLPFPSFFFFLASALRVTSPLNFASQEESSPHLAISFYLELNFSALTNHSRLEQPAEMLQALDLDRHQADLLDALDWKNQVKSRI